MAKDMYVLVPYTGSRTFVLPACDEDGDNLEVQIVTGASAGELAFDSSNPLRVIYTLEQWSARQDEFVYRLGDSDGLWSREAKVTLFPVPVVWIETAPQVENNPNIGWAEGLEQRTVSLVLRRDAVTQQPLVVSLAFGGMAKPGIDYIVYANGSRIHVDENGIGKVSFQSGMDAVSLELCAIEDATREGRETVTINIVGYRLRFEDVLGDAWPELRDWNGYLIPELLGQPQHVS
jgi:hypothetical protein